MYTLSNICNEVLEKVAARSNIQKLIQAQRAHTRATQNFKPFFDAIIRGDHNKHDVRRNAQLFRAAVARKKRLGAVTPQFAGFYVPREERHLGWNSPTLKANGIVKGMNTWNE